MAGIGGTTGKLHRQQGEQQRCGIGKHMPGISQQRQRAGDQTADDLNNHKGCGDAEGQQQSFSVVVAGVSGNVCAPCFFPDSLLFLV
jgi:hypothetical protein